MKTLVFFNERSVIWINEMISLHHPHKTACAFELHAFNMLGNESRVVFTSGGFTSWIAGWSSRCRGPIDSDAILAAANLISDDALLDLSPDSSLWVYPLRWHITSLRMLAEENTADSNAYPEVGKLRTHPGFSLGTMLNKWQSSSWTSPQCSEFVWSSVCPWPYSSSTFLENWWAKQLYQ